MGSSAARGSPNTQRAARLLAGNQRACEQMSSLFGTHLAERGTAAHRQASQAAWQAKAAKRERTESAAGNVGQQQQATCLLHSMQVAAVLS